MRPILIRTLLATVFALLLAMPALAQEDSPPERPKTALERTKELEATAISPSELLTTAILRLRRKDQFVVRANVEHKQPEADPAKPGAPGQAVQIVVAGPGGSEPDPFEGNVEAWRDAKGVVVLVSEKEIPGFGLYIREDKTIRRLTFEDGAPGLGQLQAELLSLLDAERLVPHLQAATLTHTADEATGDHVFTGKISRDVVRPTRAVANDPVAAAMMAAHMAPRVLRAEVELRLSKEGKLKQTRFTIVHNDPKREMLQGGFGGRIVIRGGGAVPIRIPQQEDNDKDKDKHEIDGTASVYTLDLTTTEASERAKAFKRDMQRIAEK